MKNIKLSKLWDSLHSSYWFVPTLMAIIALALAFTMLTLDRAGKSGVIEKLGWIYTGGPDGARTLLSAVAGSMVSVAATAFSITIVALQLASSHFGPRLLRNFMQDTGNQVVLGIFIGTFVHLLFARTTDRPWRGLQRVCAADISHVRHGVGDRQHRRTDLLYQSRINHNSSFARNLSS